ncbi:MAG TPA: biopolymer transporter ExbD [Verrucomicrobiales bacterium]|jgi:biopolymer transport protein ExbD/biopolymer transport protein TolR|nr:biopolymer transporter ExbD [Pedosphaera sp.]MBL6842609.1 biopolymer transporter ExbD [Verrucomicrobiae bacterium]MBT3595184.1 biopolymer transporter ExbD [Verrucomicrobiota bacterium]RZO73459.1 MAG: biopolymer transporter ExbD [Limisphaerales bacterium]HAO66156.1 biopolymer transporter ExbD [Verrucomicrobiales bacterium]|tara:strand:+ start:314 stop:727 length:414 start_codon:yes stop_codon:yes gene_type:complete
MRRYTQKTALVTLSDINITPLLDLAFVLLIIFMITTPLMEQGLRLDLPKGKVADNAPEKRDLKLIEVDTSGEYFIDKQPFTIEAIQSELATAFEENPNLVLVIRGDLKAAWGNIYAVLDKAKQLGMQNIYFKNELAN